MGFIKEEIGVWTDIQTLSKKKAQKTGNQIEEYLNELLDTNLGEKLGK